MRGHRLRRAALAALVATVAALTSTTAVAATPTAHGGDQAAFTQLRQRQEDAWARGDGTAWAATFTQDGDMVTFNGDYLHGRDDIAARMQHYFDTYLQGTRLLMLTEHVRYTEPDTAIIVRTGCVLWDAQTTCTDEALSVNTNVLIKRHGRWLQTSFQNTRIRPIP
ncbi:SgcJ/EcaC family oxidoreductase [Actinophytocola sp.]|uniref:SgcJ/EcaC family oxidoreductase n=1 Tax=Actinophytocola sp. TaxID=1872138 RepID=UPI003899B126